MNSAAMDGAYQTVGRHSGIMNCTSCLSLRERWPSEARPERGNKGGKPSQAPSVTALPEGEPRGCIRWHGKWSVSVPIRSIHCLRLSIKERRRTVPFPERAAALYDLGWTLLLTLLPAPDRYFSAPARRLRRGAGWIPPCRPSAAGFSPSGRCGIWSAPSPPPTGRTPE